MCPPIEMDTAVKYFEPNLTKILQVISEIASYCDKQLKFHIVFLFSLVLERQNMQMAVVLKFVLQRHQILLLDLDSQCIHIDY